MSKLNKTAFIVEGTRESKIINRMMKSLPNKSILDVVLILPAELNLYMLWNDIKDEPDIDIIDYLKGRSKSNNTVLGGMNSQDFSEVYLFFDLDAQQDNIKYSSIEELIVIIKSMLNTFNNETDKGKLYISYPMCESYSDYIIGTCKVFSGYCFQNPFDKGYKNRVGTNNNNAILTHLNTDKIKEIINCYFCRLTCLFGEDEIYDYEKVKNISVLDVFDKQSKLLKNKSIMVLSAFPEFIVDYYKLDSLKKMFPVTSIYYYKECKYRNSLAEVTNGKISI